MSEESLAGGSIPSLSNPENAIDLVIELELLNFEVQAP